MFVILKSNACIRMNTNTITNTNMNADTNATMDYLDMNANMHINTRLC